MDQYDPMHCYNITRISSQFYFHTYKKKKRIKDVHFINIQYLWIEPVVAIG